MASLSLATSHVFQFFKWPCLLKGVTTCPSILAGIRVPHLLLWLKQATHENKTSPKP